MDPFPIHVPTPRANTARLRSINQWENYNLAVMWSLLSLVLIVFVVIANVRKLMIANNFGSTMINVLSSNTLSGPESMIHNLTTTELTR